MNFKVSYSCTQNVKPIIQAHNAKLIKQIVVNQENDPKKYCNCRQPTECVMKNRCKTGPVVYQASLSILVQLKTLKKVMQITIKNEKNKTSNSSLPIGLARKAWTRIRN